MRQPRKPSAQFLARVRVRAYYYSINRNLVDCLGNVVTCPVAQWLAAEAHERAVVARKTASAAKSKAKARAAAPTFDVVAGRVVVECPAPQEGQALH